MPDDAKRCGDCGRQLSFFARPSTTLCIETGSPSCVAYVLGHRAGLAEGERRAFAEVAANMRSDINPTSVGAYKQRMSAHWRRRADQSASKEGESDGE